LNRILIFIFFCFSVNLNANEIVVAGIRGSINSEISYLVLKEAYESLGFKLSWRPYTGEDSLKISNDGQIDGELFRIDNIHRRYTNLVKIPTSINSLQAVVYSHDENFVVNGWQSIRKSNVGIQNGIKFSELATKDMNTFKAETTKQLFKTLDSKRVDVAIVSRVNGLETFKDNKDLKIYELRPFIQEYELFHYLHKKNQNLVSKLNTALLKMRSRGRITEIRERYLEKLIEKNE
jgi:hypothetical protein